MLKRTLLGLFVAAVCSTNAFAQNDFFLAYGDGTQTSSLSDSASTNLVDGTGSVFLYSASGADFESIRVDIASSNESVAEITSATIFNPDFQSFFGTLNRFTNSDAAPGDIAARGDDIVITADKSEFLITASGSFNDDVGVVAARSASDETFNAGQNAFLIAEINYDIVGAGTTEFSIIPDVDLNTGQVISFLVDTSPDVVFIEDAVLGSATLTVASSVSVPEPSSAILLALGFAGFATRRRR